MASSLRASRKRKKDKQGMLILGVVLVLFVSIVAALVEVKSNHVTRNGDNLCREDGFVSRETALVFDATDKFSDTQAMVLKKRVIGLLESAKNDERFTVYVLNDQVGVYAPKFTVCNPGDGLDRSEFTANKRRLYNDWKINFVGKVTQVVDEIITLSAGATSPIMEMIKFASIETMMDSRAKERRIVIVSDMLHHTERYSHYRSDHSFDLLADTPYGQEMRPYLKGVTLDVLYISRASQGKLQNRRHVEFWQNYIANGGGQVVNVEKIN